MKVKSFFLLCVCLSTLVCLGKGFTLNGKAGTIISGKKNTVEFDTAFENPLASLRCPECKQELLPEPGAKLNYTQIMFDHAQVTGAEEYLIEITSDKEGYTFEHPLAKKVDSSTAVMMSNFDFGEKYLWRYTGLHNGKPLGWNGPYSFETLTDPVADKKQFRLRVLDNDTLQNAGGLVILDISGNIVDRSGKVVWFLPWRPDAYVNENLQTIANLKNNDMRFTESGTITALNNHKALEKDLRGNILWQAPKRSASYHDSLTPGAPYNYHHCFKKLQNGHYMVLDMEYLSLTDSVVYGSHMMPDGAMQKDTEKVIIPYDIIKEFDYNGNMVWNWRAKNYFDTLQLNGPNRETVKHNRDGHINSFDADEKNGIVYAGFRNLNRVIKIDKKTETVLCSWGDKMSYKGAGNGEGFFLRQHGSTLLRDGSVAVFNNNPDPKPMHGEAPVSSVVVFSQPDAKQNSRIIWKYECRLDTADNMASVSGNADELKNGNLLVCMGAVNRVFEVTRSKQIVWNALVESYNAVDSAWHKFPLYRAHYTSSLYPCYFTIQTGRKVIKDGKVILELKVFNDGTENDSYQVEIAGSGSDHKQQFSTEILPGRKSISFVIDPGLKLPENGLVSVLVTSKANPGFKRIAYLRK